MRLARLRLIALCLKLYLLEGRMRRPEEEEVEGKDRSAFADLVFFLRFSSYWRSRDLRADAANYWPALAPVAASAIGSRPGWFIRSDWID